jgi:hypothetical protein
MYPTLSTTCSSSELLLRHSALRNSPHPMGVTCRQAIRALCTLSYQRRSPCKAPSFSCSYANFPVSWALVLASLGVPILCFALYQIWARSPHDFHHATLGLLEGFALTILLTALIKVFAGSYRPFYGNMANPDADSRKSFVYDSLVVCRRC